MCSQEVRRMEVMRLLGDKANPHNRKKRIGYADFFVLRELIVAVTAKISREICKRHVAEVALLAF